MSLGNPYELMISWFIDGQKVEETMAFPGDFTALIRSNGSQSQISLTNYTFHLNDTELTCGFELDLVYGGRLESEKAVLILVESGMYVRMFELYCSNHFLNRQIVLVSCRICSCETFSLQ